MCPLMRPRPIACGQVTASQKQAKGVQEQSPGLKRLAKSKKQLLLFFVGGGLEKLVCSSWPTRCGWPNTDWGSWLTAHGHGSPDKKGKKLQGLVFPWAPQPHKPTAALQERHCLRVGLQGSRQASCNPGKKMAPGPPLQVKQQWSEPGNSLK